MDPVPDGPTVIVIGASLGGVGALLDLAPQLPEGIDATLLVALHIGMHDSGMPQLMARRCRLPCAYAEDGQRIERGRIFFAPPDRHLLLRGDVLALSHGAKENFARPAIDPLFRSAALTWKGPLVGVVLTGLLDDGAAGLRTIKESGGIAVVQEPGDAQAASMPLAALAATTVDHRVRLASLGALLARLAGTPPPREASQPTRAQLDELALTFGEDVGDSFAVLSRIGRQSSLTCPECGGALWSLDESSPPRFRCHTGHAFTLRSLEHLQSQFCDSSMWTTLRALVEKQELLARITAGYDEQGDTDAAVAARRLSSSVRDTAAALRALLEKMSGSVDGTAPPASTAESMGQGCPDPPADP